MKYNEITFLNIKQPNVWSLQLQQLDWVGLLQMFFFFGGQLLQKMQDFWNPDETQEFSGQPYFVSLFKEASKPE